MNIVNSSITNAQNKAPMDLSSGVSQSLPAPSLSNTGHRPQAQGNHPALHIAASRVPLLCSQTGHMKRQAAR